VKCEISRGRQHRSDRWIYALRVSSPRWKQAEDALCASIYHRLDLARELLPFVSTRSSADLSDDVEIELDGIGGTHVDVKDPFPVGQHTFHFFR
jgi:hypothetical protein